MRNMEQTKKVIIIIAVLILLMAFMSLFQLLINTSADFVARVWVIYYPILGIIGLCYLFFGIHFKKLMKHSLLIHFSISAVSIAWYILYANAIINTLSFEKLNYFGDWIYALTIFTGIISLIVPQVIIELKIAKIYKSYKRG